MIFVLITCDTGRCIQLMRLSLPHAQENVVDRHKRVESLNDDDEVAVKYTYLKNTNLYQCVTFFFHLSPFVKFLFIRGLKSDL